MKNVNRTLINSQTGRLSLLSLTLLISGCGGSTPTAGLSELETKGQKLFLEKSCNACHNLESTRLVGPGMKGIFGRKVKVKTGETVHEITSDEAYISRSIKQPDADIVDGFTSGQMALPVPVNDEEITALTAFLKSVK